MLSIRTFSLSVTISLALLAVSALAADADQAVEQESHLQQGTQSAVLEEQLALINEQVAAIEQQYGRFDRRLEEVLQAQAQVNIELGDFEEVHSILERRLALVRVSDGLVDHAQLPIISELIENDIRRRDWQKVTDRFELIASLHSQDTNSDPELILQSWDDLASWQLAGIYLYPSQRGQRSFRAARQLIGDNLRYAEDIYPEDSPEFIDWLYKKAVLQHQLVRILNADDDLGVKARDEILRVEGRGTESYLREGLNAVKRIREIVEATGDLEAEAMAMTYEADFQILLGLGTAARLYRQAMDKFVEAGIARTEAEAFFQRPIVLPEEQFFLSMADAISHQESYGYRTIPGQNGEPATVHLGRFIAWSESVPAAHSPPLPELARSLASELQYHQIEMEFTLYTRGYTRNPDILESSSDRARVRRNSREAMKEMAFRPWFVEGRWRRKDDLRITYLVPPE